MQLVLRKVEFNACQVSLAVAQLLLSRPMNFSPHPHMCCNGVWPLLKNSAKFNLFQGCPEIVNPIFCVINC